jgi:transcriptional regulator with XRE-family HTH domain
MDVGREIRRLREAKGWSQAKLAGDTGMGVSGISQIETGARNPSAVTLWKIAEALEVQVGDLFPKAGSSSSGEPSLFNGLEGGLNLKASFWIECLNMHANLYERIIARGDYDLETMWTLEGAVTELWGTYCLTVRKLVLQWRTPGQADALQQAENRIKGVRAAAREAYRECRETEQDRRKVIDLDARRQGREERYTLSDQADAGA